MAEGPSTADAPGEPFVLAAFDFDGTISHRDSLLPFLVAVRGRTAVAGALVRISPQLAAMAIGHGDRDAAKERLVAALLTGHSAEEIDAAGRRHADELGDRLRPATLERVRWHRDKGHRLVMISASPAVYLEPLAADLGFDAVLATGLEADDTGRLTGRLSGANVRGPEKVARLDAWLGERRPTELWAYGDSEGDRELLAAADHAFRVERSGAIRRT
ncbi:MAG TPA: HAD-IB family hydrolase [Acidimicrobiia bacterium]|nr:HAD-IB family hydrolase [Acidimicrobiia bacterium]